MVTLENTGNNDPRMQDKNFVPNAQKICPGQGKKNVTTRSNLSDIHFKLQ